MAVKKFGLQQFLNHPQSKSSGFVKFNIAPDTHPGTIGFSAEAQVADCTNKVYLEFEPRSLYLTGASKYDAQSILKTKRSIRHRRQKVDRFRKAVVAFCDAMDESLDEMEWQVNSIPPTRIYDSRKGKP